ncbi:MAG: aspartate 1-decarboxylase [Bdellovibrionales bacterium]|nr:aspartate 1-decarboxylase [Bdellovibrionales bacterium]
MQRTMMKSKIHRATVTDADLSYEGSITIDRKLMEMADLLENEKVDIYNCNNGARFSTYVIPGDDGQICLNGAAARHVHRGDIVIIVSYTTMDTVQAKAYKPKVVLVDSANKAKNLQDL